MGQRAFCLEWIVMAGAYKIYETGKERLKIYLHCFLEWENVRT